MPKTKEEEKLYRREYMKKYNASEKGKAYNAAHVKAWRAAGNRKPEKRNPAKEYRETIVDFLVNRDGLVCALCNQIMIDEKMEIDHIIPRALGGANKMSNLRMVHAFCNRSSGLETRKIVKGY